MWSLLGQLLGKSVLKKSAGPKQDLTWQKPLLGSSEGRQKPLFGMDAKQSKPLFSARGPQPPIKVKQTDEVSHLPVIEDETQGNAFQKWLAEQRRRWQERDKGKKAPPVPKSKTSDSTAFKMTKNPLSKMEPKLRKEQSELLGKELEQHLDVIEQSTTDVDTVEQMKRRGKLTTALKNRTGVLKKSGSSKQVTAPPKSPLLLAKQQSDTTLSRSVTSGETRARKRSGAITERPKKLPAKKVDSPREKIVKQLEEVQEKSETPPLEDTPKTKVTPKTGTTVTQQQSVSRTILPKKKVDLTKPPVVEKQVGEKQVVKQEVLQQQTTDQTVEETPKVDVDQYWQESMEKWWRALPPDLQQKNIQYAPKSAKITPQPQEMVDLSSDSEQQQVVQKKTTDVDVTEIGKKPPPLPPKKKTAEATPKKRARSNAILGPYKRPKVQDSEVTPQKQTVVETTEVTEQQTLPQKKTEPQTPPQEKAEQQTTEVNEQQTTEVIEQQTTEVTPQKKAKVQTELVTEQQTPPQKKTSQTSDVVEQPPKKQESTDTQQTVEPKLTSPPGDEQGKKSIVPIPLVTAPKITGITPSPQEMTDLEPLTKTHEPNVIGQKEPPSTKGPVPLLTKTRKDQIKMLEAIDKGETIVEKDNVLDRMKKRYVRKRLIEKQRLGINTTTSQEQQVYRMVTPSSKQRTRRDPVKKVPRKKREFTEEEKKKLRVVGAKTHLFTTKKKGTAEDKRKEKAKRITLTEDEIANVRVTGGTRKKTSRKKGGVERKSDSLIAKWAISKGMKKPRHGQKREGYLDDDEVGEEELEKRIKARRKRSTAKRSQKRHPDFFKKDSEVREEVRKARIETRLKRSEKYDMTEARRMKILKYLYKVNPVPKEKLLIEDDEGYDPDKFKKNSFGKLIALTEEEQEQRQADKKAGKKLEEPKKKADDDLMLEAFFNYLDESQLQKALEKLPGGVRLRPIETKHLIAEKKKVGVKRPTEGGSKRVRPPRLLKPPKLLGGRTRMAKVVTEQEQVQLDSEGQPLLDENGQPIPLKKSSTAPTTLSQIMIDEIGKQKGGSKLLEEIRAGKPILTNQGVWGKVVGRDSSEMVALTDLTDGEKQVLKKMGVTVDEPQVSPVVKKTPERKPLERKKLSIGRSTQQKPLGPQDLLVSTGKLAQVTGNQETVFLTNEGVVLDANGQPVKLLAKTTTTETTTSTKTTGQGKQTGKTLWKAPKTPIKRVKIGTSQKTVALTGDVLVETQELIDHVVNVERLGSGSVDVMKKLSEAQLMQVLRHIAEGTPEGRRLLAEIREKLAELRHYDEMRKH